MKFKIGFSLIEILVALTLFAIVLLIGVPSLQHALLQNRVDSSIHQMITAISFARSEAIRRQQRVSFCASEDGQRCRGTWRSGQILMADQKVLRVYSALPPGDNLMWVSSLSKNDVLEILPTGFTNGQQGSFYYCPPNKQYAKRIIVTQTGRVRVVNDATRCP